MTLPATGYALANATNPSAAIAAGLVIVDLSRAPAAWWSACDTDDATRGRMALGDGTEIAVDWVSFSRAGSTGWAVGLYGAMSDSGDLPVRVYPPQAANAAVAAGDTYGSYAVYSGVGSVAFYPLRDGTGSTAANRTSASGAGTLGAGMTFNAAGGVDADGQSNAVIDLPVDFKPLDGETAFSVVARVNATDINSDRGIFYTDGHTGSEPLLLWLDTAAVDHVAALITGTNTTGTMVAGAAASAATDYHLVLTSDTASNINLYIDGSADTTGSFPFSPVTGGLQATDSHYRIGQDATANKAFYGRIYYLYLYNRALTAAEADQLNAMDDQAAYWGTWAWEPPVSGTSLSGSAAAQADASGELAQAASLSGSADATASAAGETDQAAAISGSADAQADAAGETDVAATLSGSADAQADAAGEADVAATLSGSAGATATAAGETGQVATLSGSAAATASATGELTSSQASDWNGRLANPGEAARRITLTMAVGSGYRPGDYARLCHNSGAGAIDWDAPLAERHELLPGGAGLHGFGHGPFGRGPFGRAAAHGTPGFGRTPFGHGPFGHGCPVVKATLDVAGCGQWQLGLKLHDAAGNAHSGSPATAAVEIHQKPPAPRTAPTISHNPLTGILTATVT